MATKRPLVQLIHWKENELAEREARLRDAGYDVKSAHSDGLAALQAIRRHSPAAVIIDLGRLPSHGREVAIALRQQKATRDIPFVFVEGEPEKIARIRALLPDATYTVWSKIGAALPKAIARKPAAQVVPAGTMAGYSGTPLPKKLGIKPGSRTLLIGAPQGFDQTLGELPPGAKVARTARTECDLIILFVRSLAALAKGVKTLGERDDTVPAWIAWPKKTSALAGDVTEREVRAAGLAAGMVDYKICAIDDTWSGLLFSRKRAARLPGS